MSCASGRRLWPGTASAMASSSSVEGVCLSATSKRGNRLKISTALDQIDIGSMALPEFQRGYVWNRDQVRGLMTSLYRGYPVGGLLVWETTSQDITVRGAVAGSGT